MIIDGVQKVAKEQGDTEVTDKLLDSFLVSYRNKLLKAEKTGVDITADLTVVNEYYPSVLTDDELNTVVEDVIINKGFSSLKEVMAHFKNADMLVDMKQVRSFAMKLFKQATTKTSGK